MNKPLQNIKTHQRIKLNVWQCLGHYSFMLFPLFFPAFEIFYNLSGKTAVNTLSITSKLIFLSLSLLIGYFKWRELSYYQINGKRTNEEFENAVFASANKLNWNIISFNNKIVEAVAFNIWKSRDPQKITIKREEDRVLINSMIVPGFLSPPDFIGVNKTNRLTFSHYFQQSNKVKDLNEKVIQYLKDAEEQVENEPEWSLKNTLKRLIAYLLSFGFLGIGITIWKDEGFNLTVLLCGVLGSFYIVLDIYVMWTKRRKLTFKNR